MRSRSDRRPLSDLTSSEAVIRAVEEFDAIGRDAFLERYGFGPALRFFLLLDGKRYDSKAIVGAAYGKQYPNREPLRCSEFSGGTATVKSLLNRLGFEVEVLPPPRKN